MDGNFSFSKCVVIKVIYVSILTIIEVTNLATGILIIQIIMLTIVMSIINVIMLIVTMFIIKVMVFILLCNIYTID